MQIVKPTSYAVALTANINRTLFADVTTGVAYNATTAGALTLAGADDGFYDYTNQTRLIGTTAITNSLTGAVLDSTGSAGLNADGYHLLGSSDVLNHTYTVASGNPLVDIDGDARPLGSQGDIGADQVVPEPATLGFLAIGGLAIAGAGIRRRRPRS